MYEIKFISVAFCVISSIVLFHFFGCFPATDLWQQLTQLWLSPVVTNKTAAVY